MMDIGQWSRIYSRVAWILMSACWETNERFSAFADSYIMYVFRHTKCFLVFLGFVGKYDKNELILRK